MSTKFPWLPSLFGCAVFLGSVWVVRRSLSANDSLLDIGGFAVLAATLVVLVFYAYDTNSIARVTRESWERRGVFGTSYAMKALPEAEMPRGRTLFVLDNQSTLVVEAKVHSRFRVYEQLVDCQPAMAGRVLWVLFPRQSSQGWFEIEPLVEQQGKSIAQMKSEQSDANRKRQLTMDVQIEFRDELGERRTLPTRRAFFDFNGWTWIPELNKEDDWDSTPGLG